MKSFVFFFVLCLTIGASAQPGGNPTRSRTPDRDEEFIIRAGRQDRAVVTSDGRFGMNVSPPTRQLDIRFSDDTRYDPSRWGMDGLLLYNHLASSRLGHGAALILAARGGQGAFMSRAIMAGEVTGANRMDLVFQTEYEGPDIMRESMRITSAGFVGIGTSPGLPRRTLHTVGTIRFEELSLGRGMPLVVDANGDVYRGGGDPDPRASVHSERIAAAEERLLSLERELADLRAVREADMKEVESLRAEVAELRTLRDTVKEIQALLPKKKGK